MTDYVRLGRQGLQASSLECPKGGEHHVQAAQVVLAKRQGSGQAVCEKCGQTVVLTRRG